MKKMYILRTFKVIISFLIIASLVIASNYVCSYSDLITTKSVKSFYSEDDDSLDYVFIGSSAVSRDVLPPVIWNNSQLTGSCVCVTSCDSRIYPSMLEEVIVHQKNALILVDIDSFCFGYGQDLTPTRFWLESMDKNDNWKHMIDKYDSDNLIEYYIPLMRNHRSFFDSLKSINKTLEIKNSIKNNKPNLLRGSDCSTISTMKDEKRENLIAIDSNQIDTKPFFDENIDFLYEFLDNCKDNNIKNVLFVDFPKSYYDNETYDLKSDIESKVKYCTMIIEKYGYSVLNYNELNNPCKFNAFDFLDTSHLTTSAAIKFSQFLGEYISNNYKFSQKTERVISEWDKNTKNAYQKYELK